MLPEHDAAHIALRKDYDTPECYADEMRQKMIRCHYLFSDTFLSRHTYDITKMYVTYDAASAFGPRCHYFRHFRRHTPYCKAAAVIVHIRLRDYYLRCRAHYYGHAIIPSCHMMYAIFARRHARRSAMLMPLLQHIDVPCFRRER